ncbi:MAG: ImmA/IrrE family metallo-endopeptidase [bacterium]|nr:ImmA/IrrE family metallo-endopeptidase [bacterium]
MARDNNLVHGSVHGFVHKKTIEAGALVLLAEYGRKYHVSVQPPIPVEEIIEAHLGLTFDIEDLPRLLNVRDVLGATWFRSREVKIDQSLDPTVFPSKLGRYRFTVAHEVGHWELHRQLYLSAEGQAAIFAGADRPVICRSNDKSPLEWQADSFAGYLLMPKSMVFAQWEAMHGSREPYIAVDEIAGLKVRWGLGEDERPTVEVARQMASAFQVSAQAMQIRLIDLGLIRTDVPEPGLFS